MKEEIKNEETITLVTVCNNNFVVLLAALLKSLEENHISTERIDLYIVDDNITEKNKQKIIASLHPNKLTLIWIALADAIPKHLQLPLDSTTFPANTYARICIPYFINPTAEKAIYLDVDMIVLKDIAKLWYTDIADFNIAAVADRSEVVSSPWGGIKNYAALGLKAESRYLNSGIFVLRPKEWKRLKIPEQAFECAHENISFISFADQYSLNVIFNERWFELDKRWNSYAQLEEKQPYIIHFTGMKPIFKGYEANLAYKNLFFHYLNKTEWKGFKQKSNILRFLQKLYNKALKRINSSLRK
ncbi:lipopolysaccharide biosynthesis glycosyltransferase [Pedobacter sp. UYP30]|uniref:glycosyltransferase family 8 protein n=1 Tax=Pedobacter sp. UYP30 TaxID=1756400 RepID=UPI003395F217